MKGEKVRQGNVRQSGFGGPTYLRDFDVNVMKFVTLGRPLVARALNSMGAEECLTLSTFSHFRSFLICRA